jgi:protease-4
VQTLADGRIYTGEEALKKGLVDRLGNFEDAIEWAGRMGGIEGKISTVYTSAKITFTLLRYISESILSMDLMSNIVAQTLQGGYIYKNTD